MKDKTPKSPAIHIGTPMMLVIFLILTMVIFAILTLSASVMDYQSSVKQAERTTAYYQAISQAEQQLAQIDQCIQTTQISQLKPALEALDCLLLQPSEEQYQLYLQQLHSETHAQLEPDAMLAAYAVPIDDTAYLQICLLIQPEEQPGYTILTWKKCNVSDWEGSDTLPVLR